MERIIRLDEKILIDANVYDIRSLCDVCFDLNESPSERFIIKKTNTIVNIYNDIRKIVILSDKNSWRSLFCIYND